MNLDTDMQWAFHKGVHTTMKKMLITLKLNWVTPKEMENLLKYYDPRVAFRR